MNSEKPIKLGVLGATGRMGREIMSAAEKNSSFDLKIALANKNHVNIKNYLNKDNENSVSTSFEHEKIDVLIDFSAPSGTLSYLPLCKKHKIPMVIGVTNFSQDEKNIINETSKHIPIVMAPNMSLGVNVLFSLIEKFSPMLNDYDVEIFEAHHKYKKDAPSGTAMKLGDIIAQSKGKNIEDIAVFNRCQNDYKRKDGEIGFSVVRSGEIIGEHKIIFTGNNESIEIIHKAQSREHFATGSFMAAKFAIQKDNGLYNMNDVLNFKLKCEI